MWLKQPKCFCSDISLYLLFPSLIHLPPSPSSLPPSQLYSCPPSLFPSLLTSSLPQTHEHPGVPLTLQFLPSALSTFSVVLANLHVEQQQQVRCVWGENRGKWKELRQPDNHQPSQSSIYILHRWYWSASVSHPLQWMKLFYSRTSE